MLSLLGNILTAVLALGAVYAHAKRRPLSVLLRYFTVQSNLFCAAASIAVAAMRLLGQRWIPVLVLKFVGTVAVTVTLLTVVFFLSRQYGFKVLLTGPDLWLHLVCPVLALLSYVAWDRVTMPAAAALLGVLPVVLYGTLYLRKVVFDNRWEDFYGFNQNGRWRVSFLVMVLATAVLSLLLWAAA